jgi:hypothetical protein
MKDFDYIKMNGATIKKILYNFWLKIISQADIFVDGMIILKGY